MSLIKGLFKYLFILLGLLALGVAILAAVMFFVPSVSIFGYRFKSSHAEHTISLAETTDINKVTIKTSAYNINVKPNTNSISPNTFYITIKNNYTGYANSKNDEVLINGQKISEINKFTNDSILENKVDAEGNVVMNGDQPVKIAGSYMIDLTELSGIISLGGSNVTIYVPQTSHYIDYTLETRSGKISFSKVAGSDSKVKTNNLNISTTSARGTFSLDNVEMVSTATLEIKNFLGRIQINSDIGGSVKISSKTGSFMFNNIGTEGVSSIEGETVESGTKQVMLLITGDNPYVSFKKLNGSLKLTSPSGIVEGEIVNGDIISNSTNARIEVAKLLGGCNIQTKQGNVIINQVGESIAELRPINITTTTGEVKLGQEKKIVRDEETITYGYVYGKVSTIVTTSGKVTLDNVLNHIDNISTDNGYVNVTFAKNSTVKNANISTKSGAININNIYGNVVAKTENSAPINASYYQIGGSSDFTTDEGNIKLTIFAPSDESSKQYRLSMKSKSNKFDCQIGNYTLTKLGEETKVDGYYTTQNNFPTDATPTFTLNLKTNAGKIIVGY